MASVRIFTIFIFSSLVWFEGRCVFLEDTILYPSVRAGEPRFGNSVAISCDGSRALVGADKDEIKGTGVLGTNAGAAYVFDVNPSDPTDWTEQTILYPSSSAAENSEFGTSVAISCDGSRALVGAYFDDTEGTDAGATYVFDVNPSDPTDWTEQTILYPSVGADKNPRFGNSVAISSDGRRALVGAYTDSTKGLGAGATYVFDVNPSDPTDWTEQAILYPNVGTGIPLFGQSVAISSDGSRILVGANQDNTTDGNPAGYPQGAPGGATYVFDVNPSDPTDWTEQTILYPNVGSGTPPEGNPPFGAWPNFGWSVAITSDGSRALVGATGDGTVGRIAGATYVFDVNPSDPTDWTKQTILYPRASNASGPSRFGSSVAISSDGRRALVGAYTDNTKGLGAGATYVFDVNPSDPTDWTEQTILYPSLVFGNPDFGISVAISSDGSRGLVGADLDESGGYYTGSTYVFASCSSGTIINANGTACEPCPSGQVPNADQTACIEDPSDDEGSATALFENNWMAWIFF